jgi:hypothetical protein
MLEYANVSTSSYDPAALTARLNEKAAEGWEVVAIVPTGTDITAFLRREVAGAANVAAEQPVAQPATAVDEPAGWAAAPEQRAPAAPAATAATPAGATPAGWYHDPSGRYEVRYWDGAQWTEHVARSGQQYKDPPVA